MKIKVVSRNNELTLIEWVDDGTYHRSIVPTDDVIGNDFCEHPERGIPYGEDWASLLPPLEVDLLVNELHRRGIWTAQDLQNNHKAALGAILVVAGRLLGDFVSKR